MRFFLFYFFRNHVWYGWFVYFFSGTVNSKKKKQKTKQGNHTNYKRSHYNKNLHRTATLFYLLIFKLSQQTKYNKRKYKTCTFQRKVVFFFHFIIEIT